MISVIFLSANTYYEEFCSGKFLGWVLCWLSRCDWFGGGGRRRNEYTWFQHAMDCICVWPAGKVKQAGEVGQSDGLLGCS